MALMVDPLAEEHKSVTRSIGERIAGYRKIVRMDQKELARRLGVKPSTMNRWETGYTPISVHDLMRVAQALKEPASWFLGEPPKEDEPVHRLEQSYQLLTPAHQGVLMTLLRELLRLQEAAEDTDRLDIGLTVENLQRSDCGPTVLSGAEGYGAAPSSARNTADKGENS